MTLLPMQTGDLLFVSRKHGVGLFIRLFTNLWDVMRGNYVPNHVGVFRHDDGIDWVCEAHIGKGFVRVPFDEWLRVNAKGRCRVLHMPFTGGRSEIGAAIARMEGTKYETLRDFIRIAKDKNSYDPARVVCSTAVVRILRNAGAHKAAISLMIHGLSASNTDPGEVYKWAKSVGGKEESL